MKISINFSKKNIQQVQSLWSQMYVVKATLENKLKEAYLLEVDPVKETFNLVPASEAFSFNFPISFTYPHKDFEK